MAKIATPRLPEATEEYSREQLSQLVQTLEQVIFILNNTYVPEKLKEEEESRLASKWKNLSDEKKEEAKAAARVREESDKAGTYGAALGNMQKLIVDAYIKNMMDILQIDQRL